MTLPSLVLGLNESLIRRLCVLSSLSSSLIESMSGLAASPVLQTARPNLTTPSSLTCSAPSATDSTCRPPLMAMPRRTYLSSAYSCNDLSKLPKMPGATS